MTTAAVIPLPTEPWGATPDDWFHFSLMLGLTADLIPVVSNPKAVKSPDSKLQGPGKTPSLYNGRGHMVGIAKWTEKRTEGAEVDRWAAQPDYGICLQTRSVRAIDVDITDADLAAVVAAEICARIGTALPCRSRANSPKFLLVFDLPGDFTKRRLITAHGAIEFLATGQQFVACGTHPSGVRYEWLDGLPNRVPSLDVAEFEALWAHLQAKFGVEPAVEARKGAAPLISRAAGDAKDDMVAYLVEHWDVFGQDRRTGRVDIRCPFEDEHTSDSGETATSYFPAGVGGFEQGHFRCQHAHCDHRTDEDFIRAIRPVADSFAVITPPPGEPDPLPVFKRDKSGAIPATITNVVVACRSSAMSGMEIRLDTFRDEIMFAKVGSDQWAPFGDTEYTKLRMSLERQRFRPIGRELIRDAVLFCASENRFDSAMEWLGRLTWDGVPRVENFLQGYFGTTGTDYTRAVSLYLWTALAGRVLSPGEKADMVPILIGPQGIRKSSGVAAISPAKDFFVDISFQEKDDDLSRKMRGRLVAEIGELRGLHTKEVEAIKAFTSRTHENWIPKFKEFATIFPRRLVFIGTTNKDEFLADETGNRRWLPVDCGAVDVDRITADRNQLWAEGAVLFAEGGVRFHDAERLAEAVHGNHTIQDTWCESVGAWFDTPDELSGECPRDRGGVRALDVLKFALGFDDRNIKKTDEMRIAKVLKSLGYKRAKICTDGKWSWGFVPED